MEIEKKNFFVVSRNLLNSDRWLCEKFTRGQAWIDLFGLAQHTKGYFIVRGIQINLERGQLGYSQLTLAGRWKWSRDKVRRYLKRLETAGDIRQQNNEITSIITIVNYDRWQLNNTTNDTTDKTTNKQQKNNKRYTYNNDNNDNNDKKCLQPAVADPTNDLISLFKTVNPSYKQLFINKAQRSAIERMLKFMGREKLEGAINILARTNEMEFSPHIFTPYELEKKLGALIAFVKKEQIKTPKLIKL
jgi:hypothetical protein